MSFEWLTPMKNRILIRVFVLGVVFFFKYTEADQLLT